MNFKFYATSLIISLVITMALLFVGYNWKDVLVWNVEVLSSAITLGTVLCGFDSVHKNTLLTAELSLMKSIRETEYISDLLNRMRDFTYASIAFVLISLLYILLYCGSPTQQCCAEKQEKVLIYDHPISLFFWVLFLVYMFFMFVYIHLLFTAIIKKSYS